MPRNVSLICACSASVFVQEFRDKERKKTVLGSKLWGRTGSVDRCCVLLICTLHLFFERREARGLGLGHPHRKKWG